MTALEGRVKGAQALLLAAAQLLSRDAGDEEAWRELCRARATLVALARCAS